MFNYKDFEACWWLQSLMFVIQIGLPGFPGVSGSVWRSSPRQCFLGMFCISSPACQKAEHSDALAGGEIFQQGVLGVVLFVSTIISSSSQLEPRGLLPHLYCEPLKQTLFCPAATSGWAKCCPTKHWLSVQRLPPPACISVIFFRQSVSINLIVITPKAIFSSPLELKG